MIATETTAIRSLALAHPYLRRVHVAEAIEGLVRAGREWVMPKGQVIGVLILEGLSRRPGPGGRSAPGPDTGDHRGLQPSRGLPH